MKQPTSIYIGAAFLILITVTSQQHCVCDLPGSTYNDATPKYKPEYKPRGHLAKITAGLYAVATLPMKIFNKCVETRYLNHAFTAGYAYNFIRFGSLGTKNLFEWSAEKLGAPAKYAPLAGTVAWNIPAALTTNDHLKDYETQSEINFTAPQKIKHRAAAFGSCALGAIAGTMWRKLIYKSLWYSKQQLYTQCARLAKTIKR